MKFGPIHPQNLELVRATQAPPGYYVAPGLQLMVVATPHGSRFFPMSGAKPFLQADSLEAVTLLGMRNIQVDVAFGDAVPYVKEDLWGTGYMVMGGAGKVALAAVGRPSPYAEFERVFIDVATCEQVHFDEYLVDLMWFKDWEILATRDGARSILALSPHTLSGEGTASIG